jgi:hypothetical protein
MKKIILMAFLVLASIAAYAQPVYIKLRNNSILPTKVALITYEPKDNGSNGTQIFMMLPYTTTRKIFATGTKIYLADGSQVDRVMGGKGISTDKPFLILTPTMQGKTFDIH